MGVIQATLAKIALSADAGQKTIKGDAPVLVLATALRSYKSLNGNSLILIGTRKVHTLYCARPAVDSTNFVTIDGAP